MEAGRGGGGEELWAEVSEPGQNGILGIQEEANDVRHPAGKRDGDQEEGLQRMR